MFCVSCKLLASLLQHVGRVSWPGGSVASQRGRIKQQLWPRRWSVTPSPEDADNKDSLGRPGQTRPDKHDKTGRGCKGLGNGIAGGPLALPTRDPLVQARNRGHGSAVQRRLRLFFLFSLLLCHTLPSNRPSIPSVPSIQPSQPIPSAWAPSSPNHERAVCCPRDCSQPRVNRCNGQQKKTLH